jgi:hypothetical protein
MACLFLFSENFPIWHRASLTVSRNLRPRLGYGSYRSSPGTLLLKTYVQGFHNLPFRFHLLFGVGICVRTPGNPRIIDSFSHLGVDLPTPRFGWIVNDLDRNERQSAYQIIVATNETDIDANLGSAWDTSKASTNLQYGISYSGVPLSPASKYWFKVRT